MIRGNAVRTALSHICLFAILMIVNKQPYATFMAWASTAMTANRIDAAIASRMSQFTASVTLAVRHKKYEYLNAVAGYVSRFLAFKANSFSLLHPVSSALRVNTKKEEYSGVFHQITEIRNCLLF